MLVFLNRMQVNLFSAHSQPAGSELCVRDAKPFLTVLTAVHTSFIRGAWAPSTTLREYSSTEGGNY